MIKIKRIYQKSEKTDGYRILIDGLWPRGFSKKSAKVDVWIKEVAPSRELRTWFSHDPKKWIEFKKRYKKELADKKDLTATFHQLEKKKETITLVYAAKDQHHNNAIALREFLEFF